MNNEIYLQMVEKIEDVLESYEIKRNDHFKHFRHLCIILMSACANRLDDEEEIRDFLREFQSAVVKTLVEYENLRKDLY